MPLQDFFASLTEFSVSLVRQEKAVSTVKKYIRDVKHFRQFVRDRKIQTITKETVLMYKKEMMSAYKPASLNSMLISLNRYFLWIDKPELHVKTVRIQRHSSFNVIFSKQEYLQLLKTAQSHNMERIYLIMRLLAATGIRISELRFITAESLQTDFVTVQNKGKFRDVPIPDSIRSELAGYCAKKQIASGIIFHGKNPAAMLDKAFIWREMKAVAALAGFAPEKVHAQVFRHFFAKEYMTKYNDVADLADILGHSSLETTRIYTRTSTEEKRQRMNGLHL